MIINQMIFTNLNMVTLVVWRNQYNTTMASTSLTVVVLNCGAFNDMDSLPSHFNLVLHLEHNEIFSKAPWKWKTTIINLSNLFPKEWGSGQKKHHVILKPPTPKHLKRSFNKNTIPLTLVTFFFFSAVIRWLPAEVAHSTTHWNNPWRLTAAGSAFLSCLNSKLVCEQTLHSLTPANLTQPPRLCSAPHIPATNLPLARRCGSKGSLGSSLLFPPSLSLSLPSSLPPSLSF